ncbi:MAG: hypothetical protein RQ982_03755 [Gammaproteobacteria bacterium]|nr:hypothetical protein [Gammaproteobacteria bacterium]
MVVDTLSRQWCGWENPTLIVRSKMLKAIKIHHSLGQDYMDVGGTITGK